MLACCLTSARTCARSNFSAASASGARAAACALIAASRTTLAENAEKTDLAQRAPRTRRTRRGRRPSLPGWLIEKGEVAATPCSAHSAISACDRFFRDLGERYTSERKQFINLPLAVGKGIHADTDTLEQRHVQIGERRGLGILDVPSALDAGSSATRDEDREVHVIVNVGVAHAAAIEVQRVVEQRAVPFRRRFQFFEKVRKERDVERVDLRHPRNLFRVVAMMRERMVRIRDTDLRIGPVARFTGELERDYTRDVSLKCEDLEIEHQLRVIRVGRWHACRAIEIGEDVLLGRRLRFLDAAFHLANGVQVLADASAILRTEVLLEAHDVVANPVEQAGAPLQGRTP